MMEDVVSKYINYLFICLVFYSVKQSFFYCDANVRFYFYGFILCTFMLILFFFFKFNCMCIFFCVQPGTAAIGSVAEC
jgi:hypothetical protein